MLDSFLFFNSHTLELVSDITGEPEQNLRELFEQAVSSAPCILFIDKLDALTPKGEVASMYMERLEFLKHLSSGLGYWSHHPA
ncbi:nuclear valosin-containing protein-like [Tachysurus ichikawai]